MSRVVRKAVIPAAGRGTRMLPATRVVPKELLPVAGKPLIQYAAEEAADSGIEEIILVLSKGKEAIGEHFAADCMKSSCDSARKDYKCGTCTVRIAWQESPRGLADAVLAARPFIKDESFAVILPDVLIASDIPCMAQLMARYNEHSGCLIATREVSPQEVEHFGILQMSGKKEADNTQTLRVASLLERPSKTTTPSRYGIVGRYILPPEIFDCIDSTKPGGGGELQLTDSLQLLAGRKPIFGALFEGEPYDCGSQLGLLKASIAFALKNPQMASALQEYLRHLVPHSTSATPIDSCFSSTAG